jgi:hypothetical protein
MSGCASSKALISQDDHKSVVIQYLIENKPYLLLIVQLAQPTASRRKVDFGELELGGDLF